MASLRMTGNVFAVEVLGWEAGGFFYPAGQPHPANIAEDNRKHAEMCRKLTPKDREWARRDIIMLLAGQAAQEKLGDDPERIASGCYHDRMRAEQLAYAVAGSAYETMMLEEALREAARIVDHDWGLIQRIASELWWRGWLEVEEIWACMRGDVARDLQNRLGGACLANAPLITARF